ncbi:hypothetical protein V2J09_015614 [Rumex salicifolius]
MLGLSYAEIFLILGATAALIGPKDLPIIARTAGRLAGRSIGYVQLARGQFENIMQQTQYRQVNKELQDTMAQLDAIRHEIRSISIMNPGPLTRTLTDNPDQDAADGLPSYTGPSTPSVGLQQPAPQTEPQPKQHENRELKSAFDLSKEYRSTASGLTDVHRQATTFARLAESQALASTAMKDGDGLSFGDDKPGLLSVLPVSAETAGLLPKRQGDPTGSDIVLEAVLEAEVARNAKDFFSQPQNQIKSE